MKHSSYYQKWLQVLSRGSDVLIFLFGYYLGKDVMHLALLFLGFKLVLGYTVSELMYKRMKAVVREEK